MGDLLAPTHIVFLLIVALLVFGPRKLPELGGAVGKTVKEFQKSMKDLSLSADGGDAGAKTAPGDSAKP